MDHRQSTAAPNRRELEARVDDVETEASVGCGLSDVLWSRRVRSGYARLLAQADAHTRPALEALLRDRGYEPESREPELAPDECSLTGIDVHWCHCGRHE